MREWTKKETIRWANLAGLSVGEWAPGDGATRYRFELTRTPGAGNYNATDGIYTALGLAEARTFVKGWRRGRDEGEDRAIEAYHQENLKARTLNVESLRILKHTTNCLEFVLDGKMGVNDITRDAVTAAQAEIERLSLSTLPRSWEGR